MSKGHNSNDRVFSDPEDRAAVSQTDLPFVLSGSQKKTAYALRYNCAWMIAAYGIEKIGFATFTVGNTVNGRFEQVFDSDEASRRFNSLNTGVLKTIFERFIVVTERHKNKAIHFHAIGVMRCGDIRTGFDFASITAANAARARGFVDGNAEKAYKLAAAAALRDVWALLRDVLPGYGFGRSEVTPIRTCGEAVSSYVAKYVEKNLFNRLKEDKGKKLVRYGGWSKGQLKPNEFSWATAGAIEWRTNARHLAKLVKIEDREEMAEFFGRRWAFKVTAIMREIGQAQGFNARELNQHAREWMYRQAGKSGREELTNRGLVGVQLPDDWRLAA